MSRGRAPRRMLPLVAVLLALALMGAAPPTDPLASQQWHLDKVRAARAWDGGRGGDVVVAVLDTGVDLEHPDLRDRLVEGVNLIEEGTPPDDPQGHGTLVAGIIAATADNGEGVAGAAPAARIMPVRVLDAEGRGSSANVADGIRWATDHGAAVINLSLGEAVDAGEDGAAGPGVPIDPRVREAIVAAAQAGVLLVAAAGNDGRETVPYPGDLPVLVVGATDRADQIWPPSNREARVLFAPGVEVLSTWHEGRYARSDGTSFAAPIVTAGAAILRGQGLTAEQVRARLVGTAVNIGVGTGRVDLAAAVTGIPPESAQEPAQPPAEPLPPPEVTEVVVPPPPLESAIPVVPPQPSSPPAPPTPSTPPFASGLGQPLSWRAPAAIAAAVFLLFGAVGWVIGGRRSGQA